MKSITCRTLLISGFFFIFSYKNLSAQTLSAPVDNNATANTLTAGSAIGTVVNITASSTVTGNTGANLALNKTTTVSSIETSGFPGSAAVDGNTTTTRWSSSYFLNPNADNQYIYVDLGATYNINDIKLYWESAYGKSYELQTSPDASTWTDIFSTITGAGGTEDRSGLSGSGRYVRMLGTQRGSIYGYSLYEFQIFGSAQTTYSLSTNPSSYFAINSTTGVVTANSASIPSGTYTIGVTAQSGAVSSAPSTFTITVAPATPTISGGGSVCGAAAATLTASGGSPAGGTYTWYNVSTGGAALATGTTFNPVVSGTYYVTYTSGATVSPRGSKAVTINPIVSSPYTTSMLSLPLNGNTTDVSGTDNDGTLQSSPTTTTDRYGTASSAYTFNGSSQYISTVKQIVNPATFTISLWFNTTVAGGKLIGFGANATGSNTQYDRHIYMSNSGQLYFGLWTGAYSTINTANAYNDGLWHHVIVTVGSAGSVMYVDGISQASDATMTTPENTTGYWRIGYDNVGIWTGAPTNPYFTGKLDDIAVYNRVLSSAEIAASNDLNLNGVTSQACVGSPITFSAQTITGATYSWTSPSGGTATGQNPTFASAVAGGYTLSVTGGPGGCASSATITPTLNALPTPTFTATANVDINNPATITLTSTPAAGDTYAWDFAGGSPATATTSGPFAVSWTTYGTKTITLTVTNASGCSASTTQTVTVGTISGYGFSKPLVLNTSSITGGITTTLTNFPALVYIQDNALIIGNACADKVQYPLGNGGGLTAATNYDFAFTLSGGTSELNYQVDTYDSVNGILLAWVQIPSLTSTNQNLTFYFGSKNPAHSATFSAATWSSDYLAVYHFNEGSTSAAVLDATSNGRNAVQTNTTLSNDEIHVAAGIPITGGGYSFDGSFTKIVQNTGTNADITGKFTLSAWVLYNGSNTSDNKIISDELNYGHGYKLSVKSGKIETETRTTANPSPGNLLNTGTVSSGTWTYIQGEYDGTKFINYVNGVASSTTATGGAPQAGNVINLGVDYLSTTTATNYYNGYMDEVRISNVAKSADWIKAEYYNQKNPKTFTNYSGALSQNTAVAPTLNGALTYTWTGATSTDPTVATNWTNTTVGVANQLPAFTGGATLVIPTGLARYPSLTSDITIYGLTIANGASLNLNGHNLTMGCNIYNSGTGNILYNSNNASGITWSGSIAQSYTGNATNSAQTAFMTINNSTAQTVTIKGGGFNVYNLLTLTKGSLFIDNTNSGLLTLKSSATQTANIDVIPAAYSITGLVNTERFITGGGTNSNRGYRLLSSPVNQTSPTSSTSNTFSLSYIRDHAFNSVSYPGAFIGSTTGIAGGFNNTSYGPTVYLWDERRVNDNFSYTSGKNIGLVKLTQNTFPTANTVDLSNGTTSLAVPVGNGFELFFLGPSTRTDGSTATPPADAVLTAHGYLNQQSVTVNLWYTPNGGSTGKLSYTTGLSSGAGYNMVGNPYASTINLSSVLTTNNGATGIDNIYLLSAKNSPNQTFVAYTPSGTSAPSAGYAVSGEGFIVHAKGTGSTLTFTESQKAATTQLTGPALIMSAPNSEQLNVNGTGLSLGAFKSSASDISFAEAQDALTGMYVKITKDSLTYNYCGVYFGSQWSAKFQEGDAVDFGGNAPRVMMASFSADGVRSAVKHFPDYRTQNQRIKLFAAGKTDGIYTLSLEGIRNIDTVNYKITLYDNYKRDSTDIGRYKSYAYNQTIADTASYGANRFVLGIAQVSGSKYKLASLAAQKANDGVLVNWHTLNEGNNYFFTLEKQQANGTDYSPVYNIQSNGGTNYSYTDKTPSKGNNVYRLKQVDLLGNITYAGPVSVYYDQTGTEGLFTVYLNPTAETLHINVTYGKTNTKASTYKLNIYDVTGSLIMQKSSDSANWSENVSQFKPGVYVVELKATDGYLLGKAKFVKQ